MCQPRGLRNCNPLNILRVAGTEWRGQCAEQTDKGFVQFEFIEWGIRAAFCLLRTYRDKYNAICIRDIISRWAPPSENDTERYIQNVCLWTGFGGFQRLTEKDWPRLVQAMARQECGTLLDEETINKGYKLYKNIKDEKQKHLGSAAEGTGRCHHRSPHSTRNDQLHGQRPVLNEA